MHGYIPLERQLRPVVCVLSDRSILGTFIKLQRSVVLGEILTFGSSRYSSELERPLPPETRSMIQPKVICITDAATRIIEQSHEKNEQTHLVTTPLIHLFFFKILGVIHSEVGILLKKRLYRAVLPRVVTDPRTMADTTSVSVGIVWSPVRSLLRSSLTS